MEIFFQGFVLQASLILALGAQNLFVLESGLKKNNHLLVATVCSFCDLALITIGVLGAATLFVKYEVLKISVGALGVLFLLYYALIKIKEFFKPDATQSVSNSKLYPPKKAVMVALGFTLLNPHVYLDTVVLIGGYSAKFSIVNDRLLFGLGAGGFSILWFYGLALASAALHKLLHNDKAMRWIALISGLVLFWIGIKLGIDVLNWL